MALSLQLLRAGKADTIQSWGKILLLLLAITVARGAHAERTTVEHVQETCEFAAFSLSAQRTPSIRSSTPSLRSNVATGDFSPNATSSHHSPAKDSPAQPRSPGSPVSTGRGTAESVLKALGPEFARRGYSNVSYVAVGGMGVAFRAVKDGKPVLLKANLQDDLVSVESLVAEATMGKVLSDSEAGKPERYFPETMGIEYIVDDQGNPRPVLVTEFIPDRARTVPSMAAGKPYDQVDPKYWRDNPEIWRDVQRQISVAVQRMHDLPDPLIHLDLKPSNILITFDKRGNPHVKIVDLGIARSVNGTLGRPVSPGSIFGTPGFISDRVWDGAPISPENDVFALRVIDWNMRLSMAPNPADARPDTSPYTVKRFMLPNPQAVSGSKPPTSKATFSPTVAFDRFDIATGRPLSLAERMRGYAEFSRRPRTVEARQRLIDSSDGSPRAFFEKAREDLMNMDRVPKDAVNPIRYNAAREFLESSVLTDMWGKPGGISTVQPNGQSMKAEWEAVVRGAYALRMESQKHAADPHTLGMTDPHSKLNFEDFFARAKELADRGVIKDLATLEREAVAGVKGN